MSLLPHKHKNLIFFILGIAFAIILLRQPTLHAWLLNLSRFGYLGGFLAGMLFVSTFTIATGALILVTLSEILSPVELIILAALGAVTSDFLIFKFIKDDVDAEIVPIYEEISGSHLKKILHTRYFAWTLPVIGALIIISPFPDELGVSLLGLSEIQTSKFLIISLASHTLGMICFVTAASFF